MIRSTLTAAALATAIIATPAPAAPVKCHEDQPCWNWREQGNHKRGIVTLAGRKLVVGPLRFDRLTRAYRIDWTATRKLRGDRHRFDVQDY